MDELEDKVENALAENEIEYLLQEKFNIRNKKWIEFLVEYVKNGGNTCKAYKQVYGSKVNTNTASVCGARILSKVGFDIKDYLELTGNGLKDISVALNNLKKTNSKDYLKILIKLHGLDNQKIELSGKVDVPIPIINIITEKEVGHYESS